MSEPQSLLEFLSWKPPYSEQLLDSGLLHEGTKAIIYGRYKSLKSMLVQKLAVSLSKGIPWLGFSTPTDGTSVLYLQLEIPHRMLQRRIITIVGEDTNTLKDLIFWTQHYLKLDLPQGMENLERQLVKYRPQVLIIDPIYKVLAGNILEAKSVQLFLDNIDILIDKFGLTTILVSHSRKALKDDGETWGSDDMLGSVFFSAWADSIIQVQRDGDLVNIKFDVVRHAEREIQPITVQLTQKLDFPVVFNSRM